MSDPETVSKRGGPSRKRQIGARALTVVAILLAFVGTVGLLRRPHGARRGRVQDGLAEDDRGRRDSDADCEHRGRRAVRKCRRGGGYRGSTPSGAEEVGPGSGGPLALRRVPGGGGRARAPPGSAGVGGVTTSTQRQLVRLLDDKTKFVQTDGGKVVLDLRPIIIQIGDQVVVIGKVAEKLPDSAGKVTVVDAEPAGDRADGHEDPAGSRQLDVARRACCRGTRNLACPRKSQARAACARDRRARRRPSDAGCAPRRGRLPRRPSVQGRQRQAGGPRRVEHPHAGPGRPGVGVDHPRPGHAPRSLVRRWDSACSPGAARCTARPAERLGNLRHRCGLLADPRARRSSLRPWLGDLARHARPRRSSVSKSSDAPPCERPRSRRRADSRRGSPAALASCRTRASTCDSRPPGPTS